MTASEDAASTDDGVLWVGRSNARWPGLLALVLAGGGMVLVGLVPTGWPGGLALIASTAVVLPLGRIEVMVAEAGVQVSYGRSGLLRQSFALSRLDSAATTRLSAWSGGGLGYKGSLQLIGWARAANRSGLGLRLGLDERRTFTVSVDDPEGAVDALAGLGVARGDGGG
ncbi:MAG: hypothetical protein CL466_03420 [Acidimicrobiaceae bacterium]|nr:hypothetical protein [Acidimicrobiaceae bacterium]